MIKKHQNNQLIDVQRRGLNPLGKRLYTLREAALYLGRPVWGVRELIWGGKLPVVREDGGRKMFVDICDLDNFISKNKSIYQ